MNSKAFATALGANIKRCHWQYLLISLFFSAHFLMVIAQMLPNSVWAENVADRTTRYVRYFGFEQTYAVFADPRKVNKHLVGIILYANGLTELYNYPRMEQYNLLDKMRFERYRKFLSDHLDSSTQCREFLAKYILQKHCSKANRPLLLTLIMVTTPIAPPGQSELKNIEGKFTHFVTYKVQKNDFL